MDQQEYLVNIRNLPTTFIKPLLFAQKNKNISSFLSQSAHPFISKVKRRYTFAFYERSFILPAVQPRDSVNKYAYSIL